MQGLLGHASLATTTDYVAVDRKDLHRAVEALERERRSAGEGGGSSSRA
ncbi:MAG: hypothetical protein M9894_12780 [Planctomycetes bacterium]|nr:hypothetical protein [Planctomycetota bacterium]